MLSGLERRFHGLLAPMYVSGAGAVCMAVLTALVGVLGDHTMSHRQAVVQVAIAGVTTFNVWATANLPKYTWLKKAVAIIMLGLQTVVTIHGGITSLEAVNFLIQAIATMGIAIVVHPVTTTTPDDSAPVVNPQ